MNDMRPVFYTHHEESDIIHKRRVYASLCRKIRKFRYTKPGLAVLLVPVVKEIKWQIIALEMRRAYEGVGR